MGYLFIGMSAIVLILGGAFYWYFNYSQDRFERDAQVRAELAVAVQSQQRTIEVLERAQQLQSTAINRLGSRYDEIHRETQQLQKIFSRHDLEFLSGRRPSLVEERINDGTARVLQDLEEITQPGRITEPNR